MNIVSFLACFALALALSAPRFAWGEYGYPIEDPFLATVIGTAQEDQPPLPDGVPSRTRTIVRFPYRETSSAFWDRQKLRYGVAAQDRAAPLVFVIAGTGSNYRASKMVFLEAVLWGAGFHVVSITSPTHEEFVLAGSESSMPGDVRADTRDLYAVMQLILEEERERLDVTGFRLAGYSLGATQAAFLAHLDAQEGVFGFERVLLLNPAVDLYTSIGLLDGLYPKGLPEGAKSFDELASLLLAKVTEFVHEETRPVLDSELLYRVAERQIAEGNPPELQNLYGMISAVFRIASANMIFTADVMNGGGHVIERGRKLSVGTSLTPAMKRAGGWPFVRYLDEMLLPYLRRDDPDLAREEFIAISRLASIADYLRAAGRVSVITNEDDIILAPKDLDFLRATFGERAVIYPRGGHIGNLQYRDNVAQTLRFLTIEGEPLEGHEP